MQTFNLNDLAAESEPSNQRWREFLRVPALSMGLYRLKVGQADEQQPRTEDEVYLVISGKALFRAVGWEQAVAPGSVIFVERAAEHCFVDITEDLAVLVFFAPPEGSRKGGAEQMTLPLFHVDAFTDRPFAGNPAAVCLLPSWKEDHWLQAVATEMNLSETAFLVKQPNHFDLRWFTPKVEVDLCGHATLASAHVLWQQGQATGDEIRFSTRSGILTARNKQGEIELNFPLEPDEPAPSPANLVAALDISPTYVGKNRFDYIVEVDAENTLRHVEPDFRLLATIACRGVIVTSRSADPQFDFVSRAFFPRLGVDEDPVCGSAHCCMVNFWRKRLGKSEFVAFQVSARGGVVKVRVVKDRVFLSGKAITVARGELLVGEDKP